MLLKGVIGADLVKRPSVGLVFDGWGKRVDGTAYFAITGASDFGFDKDGNRLSFPLLAFAPFLDEEKHTAEEQLTFIEVKSQIYCSTIILLILHVMIDFCRPLWDVIRCRWTILFKQQKVCYSCQQTSHWLPCTSSSSSSQDCNDSS